MAAQVADPAVRQGQLNPKQTHLLEQLQQASEELTGQELHARLRGTPHGMGLATVYRHLRTLQQRGLVRCRHLPSGEALFAPTERDEHHLTCVDCGSTVVLQSCPMHEAHLSASQLGGFQLLFHTLEFFGLCAGCQERQNSA
ncbi:transcriptional repressor [Synechococcus sp. CS-602]|uniref:Fur family transcriptional regulator n=1 Tax=Synechococcaceae TaxID=1890426 RepID=UPI0008FF237B|nr:MULTISPECIES: transcriptional repressor [Synechococcaceae]MCT4363842.1 transcriptional repressor [Candidatus Regnicoccus frigidus MAG-AL1]APD49620.1 transcriptional repressor [Synechococcus sp. SynAce01]MCT0201655.1 transcriptional repressor [Synechococcus sp. CS-603]MCT0203522.1 transcriptional repressor [Synechococcus sp. CS-602]MCT0246254.1 transcriptional repressor [Synechococcus sp. CS-601]